MSGWTEKASYLPLLLSGEAFVVYEHMLPDYDKIVTKLRKAFSLHSFQNYLQFVQRRYVQGESVDFHLSDLKRLIVLSGINEAEVDIGS